MKIKIHNDLSITAALLFDATRNYHNDDHFEIRSHLVFMREACAIMQYLDLNILKKNNRIHNLLLFLKTFKNINVHSCFFFMKPGKQMFFFLLPGLD